MRVRLVVLVAIAASVVPVVVPGRRRPRSRSQPRRRARRSCGSWSTANTGRSACTRRRPPTAKATAMPLVVVLHGAGATATEVERRYHWDPLADREHFVVAYPQALQRRWDDSGTRRRRVPARLLLDDVARRFPVDASRRLRDRHLERRGDDLPRRVRAGRPARGHRPGRGVVPRLSPGDSALGGPRPSTASRTRCWGSKVAPGRRPSPTASPAWRAGRRLFRVPHGATRRRSDGRHVVAVRPGDRRRAGHHRPRPARVAGGDPQGGQRPGEPGARRHRPRSGPSSPLIPVPDDTRPSARCDFLRTRRAGLSRTEAPRLGPRASPNRRIRWPTASPNGRSTRSLTNTVPRARRGRSKRTPTPRCAPCPQRARDRCARNGHADDGSLGPIGAAAADPP